MDKFPFLHQLEGRSRPRGRPCRLLAVPLLLRDIIHRNHHSLHRVHHPPPARHGPERLVVPCRAHPLRGPHHPVDIALPETQGRRAGSGNHSPPD